MYNFLDQYNINYSINDIKRELDFYNNEEDLTEDEKIQIISLNYYQLRRLQTKLERDLKTIETGLENDKKEEYINKLKSDLQEVKELINEFKNKIKGDE